MDRSENAPRTGDHGPFSVDDLPSLPYELEGLATEGRCPECGENYTAESLARAWDDSEH